MQIAQTEYKRNNGVTTKQFAERILNREDNPYKKEYIMGILALYHDELNKALKSGEKINLSKVGTLTPEVHTPKSCNLFGDDKREYLPYMSIKFIRNRKLIETMNARFRKNIEDGFAGLSEHCICTTQQRNTLIKKGFLEGEEMECSEE